MCQCNRSGAQAGNETNLRRRKRWAAGGEERNGVTREEILPVCTLSPWLYYEFSWPRKFQKLNFAMLLWN